MEIVCPDCEARYQVADERIVPGNRVRCARCARTWVPVARPPEPVGIAPDLTVPGPEPKPLSAADGPSVPRSEAAPPVPAARDRLAALGWAVTLVVLASVAFAAWRYRPQIEHAWPPSQRVYNLL